MSKGPTVRGGALRRAWLQLARSGATAALGSNRSHLEGGPELVIPEQVQDGRVLAHEDQGRFLGHGLVQRRVADVGERLRAHAIDPARSSRSWCLGLNGVEGPWLLRKHLQQRKRLTLDVKEHTIGASTSSEHEVSISVVMRVLGKASGGRAGARGLPCWPSLQVRRMMLSRSCARAGSVRRATGACRRGQRGGESGRWR